MRPLLLPGTHVLRRTDGSLQLGLDPDQAVVLPDSPTLRAGLLGEQLDGPHLAALVGAGVVVDERSLLPLLGEQPSGLTPSAAAALVRESGGPDARLADRRRTEVHAVGFGHPTADGLRTAVLDLLAASGCEGSPAPARKPRAGTRRVGLLVGVGEPDRELADDWLRTRTPYLAVRLTEGRAVVGPFVVPGETACLRCVDAHHTDVDPEWPLLVRQYAAACARGRADGVPEPVDPALAAVAAGWAARDLVTYVDGGRPTTWSATVVLSPDLTTVASHRWPRHPECGCTWS